MSKITPKEGEEVLMHLRKSIFVMQKQMLVFGVAVIASVLLLTFLYEYPMASISSAILLLLALFYAFYYFIIWYYDVYIITNIRVISLGKKNLFHSDFREVSYTDITDVSYEVRGIFSTIFQFGTVFLKQADGEFLSLENMGTPGVVQETIKNLVDVTNNKKYHYNK